MLIGTALFCFVLFRHCQFYMLYVIHLGILGCLHVFWLYTKCACILIYSHVLTCLTGLCGRTVYSWKSTLYKYIWNERMTWSTVVRITIMTSSSTTWSRCFPHTLVTTIWYASPMVDGLSLHFIWVPGTHRIIVNNKYATGWGILLPSMKRFLIYRTERNQLQLKWFQILDYFVTFYWDILPDSCHGGLFVPVTPLCGFENKVNWTKWKI